MAKVFDKENQMILRVPDELADKLNELFEDDNDDMDEYIDITPCIVRSPKKGDVTQFKFKFGTFESTATLVDLPCVIESHKTVDSINMLKSNDISQMLYVHPNKEKFIEDVPEYEKVAKKSNNTDQMGRGSYEARDGLTPPTKCIRTRFFRKDFPVPPNRVREVEEEMSRILDDIKKNKRDSDGTSRSSDNENLMAMNEEAFSYSGSKR